MTVPFLLLAFGKKGKNGEPMINRVEQYAKSWNMIEKSDRIVVGLSGGADSVALLLVLQELRHKYALELYAVHINHGIREEAVEDAEYARHLSQSLDIPFYLFEADIPAMAKRQGVSEEEMGRIYRYQCFRDVMKQVGANKLAVAHHMDDQAETVLFHLARGSRMAGMEGMHPVSEDVIRPLLQCRKEELVQWLQERQVSWMEDRTNADNTYARNCIRNQVVPALAKVNAQAVRHIAEFAEEMTGYRQFFQHAVDAYIEQEVTCQNDVFLADRKHLLQQDEILAKAVIYEMLARACGKKKDIGSVHVQAVYDLLHNQSGKKVILPYEMTAELSYEMLRIGKSLEETNGKLCDIQIDLQQMLAGDEMEWRVQLPYGGGLSVHLFMREEYSEQQWKTLVDKAVNSKNNYTKYFDCDTMKGALRIRNVRSEDSFVMNNQGARKKMSRYLIDEKIPAEQRGRVLVLAEDSNVLWVIGGRRSEEYKISANSEMIVKLNYEGE